MAIEWLKLKHRKRKPTQAGYRRPPDNGDQGTKHLKKKKATEAQKVAIRATQPEVVFELDAVRGKLRRKKDAR